MSDDMGKLKNLASMDQQGQARVKQIKPGPTIHTYHVQHEEPRRRSQHLDVVLQM